MMWQLEQMTVEVSVFSVTQNASSKKNDIKKYELA